MAATGSGVITMARQIGFVVGVSTLFALVGDNVEAAAIDGLRQTWLVVAVVLLAAGAVVAGTRSRGSWAARDVFPSRVEATAD
jgi:hypothetical protein